MLRISVCSRCMSAAACALAPPQTRLQSLSTADGSPWTRNAHACATRCTTHACRAAIESGLIKVQGKTPEATMASALYTDVRRKLDTSVFTRYVVSAENRIMACPFSGTRTMSKLGTVGGLLPVHRAP